MKIRKWLKSYDFRGNINNIKKNYSYRGFMFFSKSYNDKDVIEGALFLKKVDDLSLKYITHERLYDLSYDDYNMPNEYYQKKNIKMMGIYYFHLTTMYNGKPNQLNRFIKDVFKYHYNSVNKFQLFGKLNNLMGWVKNKNSSFYEGYQEASEYQDDVLKLIEKYWKDFEVWGEL